MKILINTQYKENYGAHDWDGKGHCPQYWKFKGGSTYVVENVSDNFAGTDLYGAAVEGWDVLHENFPKVVEAITVNDYSQQEYILDAQLLADDTDLDIEAWDVPYYLNIDSNGNVTCERTVANGEYGWMRKEILSKYEQWEMGPNQNRENYRCSYIMDDGSQLLGNQELQKYLTRCDLQMEHEVTGVAV